MAKRSSRRELIDTGRNKVFAERDEKVPLILIDADRHPQGYQRQELVPEAQGFPGRSALRPCVLFGRAERAGVRNLHDLRTQGLSDHSALELDFDI